MKVACIALFLLKLYISASSEAKDIFGRPTKTTGRPPVTFTVELCVVSDKDYRKGFRTLDDMAAYLVTMLNAVMLRYDDMESPKIRFQFNGVAPDGPELLSYRGGDVDITGTLAILAAHIKRSRKYSHCDVVLFLTSNSLVLKHGSQYTRANGGAVTGGICKDSRVAIAYDVPHSYHAELTIAQELAHILGSGHDGAGPSHIAGHPGSLRCPANAGYLMGNGHFGAKMYQLSTCTKEQIRMLYKTLPESCIHVQRPSRYSRSTYPGQGMTPEKFCNIAHKGATGLTSWTDYSKCEMKCCKKSGSNRSSCKTYTMLDGMGCGNGKTCKKGVCGVHNWTPVRSQ